jgi:hypothetical protein
MDQMKLAYCAGFFDGEGSISIHYSMRDHKGGKVYARWQEEVKVTQLAREPLDLFTELFGGYVYETEHYTAKGEHHYRFDWKLTSRKAHEFLEVIVPLLILKKQEAEIAIEFGKTFYASCDRGGTRNGLKPEVFEERKKLHDQIREIRQVRKDRAYR